MSSDDRIVAAVVRVGGREFDAPYHADAWQLAHAAGYSMSQVYEEGYRTVSGQFVSREGARCLGRHVA